MRQKNEKLLAIDKCIGLLEKVRKQEKGRLNRSFKKGDRVRILLHGSCVYGHLGTVVTVSSYEVRVKPDGEEAAYTYDCECLEKVKLK